MAKWKEYLASIYFDRNYPRSYSGPDKLYETLKAAGKYSNGKHKISKWLRYQDAYSLTKGTRRKFNRSRVLVEGLDSQWDIDLMDMKDVADSNNGNKNISVAIDVFSKFARCWPLRDIKGLKVLKVALMARP